MQVLLNISNLCKNYRTRGFLRVNDKRQGRSMGTKKTKKEPGFAFGPVNFTIERNKILAIVGESGSGKSSLVQTIAGLKRQTSGEIYLKGKPLSNLSQQERCKSIRMIFHDPDSSLNQKMTIGKTLLIPLRLNTNLTKTQCFQQIKETLNLVGLLPDYLTYYPQMLSVVQQHQLAIARALILNPDIIIADEILSTLDISLRFKIINLLLKIQEQRDVSFIFVAHNMHLVKHMSDQVIVMHSGIIVEHNSAQNIFSKPQSEITKRLLQNQQSDYRR
ncbi:MAG TPA: ATP-binding cassette domain-containing protein [Psychromonas hadalis]|nr:ATP-binding cassette domain-containing protein [Psychromonas hadalis]